MKEGSISLVSDPSEFSAIMAEAPVPGVQFPQLLVNPPQVPQAPQAVTPPAQAAGQVAPAPQPVQVNAADAQNELEVNFGISFFVLIGFSRCFATLDTCYRSGYDLCCVQASVFPWAYYVCLLPCFSGALAYQVRGFLSQGVGFSLALVVYSSLCPFFQPCILQ